MLRPQKITPYIPYSLPINSFYNHKDFLRKRPAKIIQIELAKSIDSYTFPSFPDHSYSTKVIKLLKRIRGLKKLSFDQYMLQKCEFTSISMKLIMKRVRRIRKLSIKDFWILVNFKTPLNLWMKNLCQLESLKYKLRGSMNLLRNQKSFFEGLKAFLRSLRYHQSRMKSLKIQLPARLSFTILILLDSSRYPRSLQKLQLSFRGVYQQQTFDAKLPCFSLSRLKKLETFALQITNDHAVVSHILENLECLPNLKSLGVLLSHSFLVQEVPEMTKLTHLSIEIPSEYTQTALLQKFRLSNLQSLELSLFISIPVRCKEIASHLSKMKQLRAFKLSISYFMEIGDLLGLLFDSISSMKLLTSLKIILTPSSPLPSQRTEEVVQSHTLLSLEKIFDKPIKIKEFSLECKYLIYEFSELMNILNKSASNFEQFKLDAAPFMIEPENLGLFVKFIENLENIKSLKLPCFEINSNMAFERMTSGIMKLKELRSISLGKIGRGKIDAKRFNESLERVLGKRGLCSLKCEITDPLKMRIQGVETPLSFEKISKKNPFLRFVSSSIKDILHMNN